MAWNYSRLTHKPHLHNPIPWPFPLVFVYYAATTTISLSLQHHPASRGSEKSHQNSGFFRRRLRRGSESDRWVPGGKSRRRRRLGMKAMEVLFWEIEAEMRVEGRELYIPSFTRRLPRHTCLMPCQCCLVVHCLMSGTGWSQCTGEYCEFP